MKKAIALFLFAAAAGAAGFLYGAKGNHSNPPDAAEQEQDGHEHEADAIAIQGLETVAAVEGEAWDTVVVPGRVTVPADRLVRIGPRIEGKVVAVGVNVGDSVRPGQVLATISSVELAEARADYHQARARLRAAQKSYEQEEKFVSLGAVSKRPLEEARSESIGAQQDLAEAKGALADAKSELARSEAELTQCTAKLVRTRDLYQDQIVSRQDLESAEAEARRDSAAVEAARVNVDQANNRLQDAQAADIAGAYLQREQKVHEGKLLDTRALLTAKAQVESASIDAEAAADKIGVLGANTDGSGDTLPIVSPIAGRVVARNTSRGEMASPSDALFTVADLSEVWVEGDVFEKDLARAQKGQAAEIRLDAHPGRVFRGVVDYVGDVLSPESRSAKLRVVVPNTDGELKGEMFAAVTLVVGRRGDAVLIPKQAVVEEAGRKFVFVPCTDCEQDTEAGKSACGSFDKLEVETGAMHGGQIEIASGVEPGIEVVTVGQHQLKTAFGSGQLTAGCAGDH